MARTASEIYDEMIGEKESLSSLSSLFPQPETAAGLLAALTSTSKAALWRLWFWVVAVITATHEQLWDAYKVEVNDLVAAKESGTAAWYVDQAKLYQHGDSLTWNGAKYVYDPVDTTNRIITFAAVIDSSGQVTIKVAKTTAGLPDPLVGGELTGFSAYMDKVRFAGTNLAVVSQSADLLKVAYKIYYDPLIMDSDGSLLSDATSFPAHTAINNHLYALPFNSVLNITGLTDAIQAAEGVVDPVFTSAEGKDAGGSYVAITENYTAEAGHMAIDPAFPLTTQITYVSA